ncbi:LANO_0G09890g1_1 [Lachancea nothofagi CBS 11611]|uniref:Mediator of RNA polymerase II transcription subunit 1 n=1 Tax=Lachancea nothofagi CBS 11611 TaxID=1266666 RepID=A0A1G4KIT2_9SACH|nr:LANO_0G09890g1_1 [Lachancea nothofagi CBS 11611]
MSDDNYVNALGQMITLLQEYKPGLVTLDNVSRLCKTLRLESFTDNIDSDTIRLSTASKIIVIDMDFHKSDKQVKDVKLVLASNFDHFNYFNDGDNGNILFNSLECFPDLRTFYHNLKFLSLLDTYSIIETESGVSSRKERLDLFRYFTELPDQLRSYFKDASVNAEIRINVDNRFGIYIMCEDKLVAKICIDESDDSAHRFYDYHYKNSEWRNEDPESAVTGVMLTLQVCDSNLFFPREFISRDLLLECDLQKPYSVVNHQKSLQLYNDITSALVPASKFNISNQNIELLGELVRWINWWQHVLSPVLHALKCPAPPPSVDLKRRSSSNSTTVSSQRRTSVSRRRRSSQQGHRPSLNESSMMKDGGLQQFTLNEVMSQPVLDEKDEEPHEVVDLILNEEYLQLGKQERCEIQMGLQEWQGFMIKFKSMSS